MMMNEKLKIVYLSVSTVASGVLGSKSAFVFYFCVCLFNFLCVWILFQNANSQLFQIFLVAWDLHADDIF